MSEVAPPRHTPNPMSTTVLPLTSLTCVIPCLNEDANLNVLLPCLTTVLKSLTVAYEIIVVDDGSTDGTPATMQRWAAQDPNIVYLQLSRNFGKEAALTAGLEAAGGSVVICMDADLQHPPALIPEMVARWQQGVEMVYAVRATRHDESAFKRFGTRVFYRLMRTSSGLQVPENAGDFRLLDRAVVDALLLLPERNRFMKGLFAWVGFRSEPLMYSPPERLFGKTTFRPLRLFHFAVDGITSFTTWPLRLLTLFGIGISMMSFLYGLIIIISHLLYGDPVQGWTTLITVVLFFAGVQLISVGIVGEYIGRIFGEVKNRPVYLLRRQVGNGLAPLAPATVTAYDGTPIRDPE